MSNAQNQRIDAAAGAAMADWESLFSAELLANAKAVAGSAEADVVSVDHLREALPSGPAVEKLLATINGEQETDGQRKVA